MADLERTIQLIFGADNQIGPVINDVSRNLSDFDSSVQALAQPLADLLPPIVALDTAILGLGVAVAGFAFNESVKLESALADLAKQLDDTDPPIEDLEKDIRSLSGQFGISSVELINAAANIKQAGFDAAGAFDILRASINLQIAGGLDAANATDVLIRSINGFKVEAADASRIVEVLNAGSNAYATSTQELANGFANLSPIAKAFNLTFEDTADLLIGTIQVFGSGTEASNALVTGLTSLLKPTKDAGAAIEDLGVKLFDANDTTRSARDFVFDFAKSFGTLNDAQQIQIATTIFGSEQSVKLTEAFNAMGRSTVDVAGAMGRVSSVQDEVNVRLATTEAVIARTVVAFQNLAQTIGKEYRGELAGIIDATGEFGRVLDEEIQAGAFDEFFEAIKPKLKAIEDLIRTVAKNLPAALGDVDFSNVLAAFDKLGISLESIFDEFFDGIDLTTVKGLQNALQDTADAFATLINVTAGIVQSFRPFFDFIGDSIRELQLFGNEAQNLAGKIIGFASQVTNFGTAIAGTFVLISESGLDMQRVVQGAIGAVVLVINGLEIALESIIILITATIGKFLELQSSVTFGDLSDRLEDLSGEFIDIAKALGFDLREDIDQFKGGLDRLFVAFGNTNPEIKEAEDRLAKMKARLSETKQEANDSSKDFGKLGDAFGGIAESAKKIEFGPLLDKVKGLASEFFKFNESLKDTDKAQSDAAKSAKNYIAAISSTGDVVRFGEVIDGLSLKLSKSGDATNDFANAQKNSANEIKNIRPIFDDVTGKLLGYEQVNKSLAVTLGDTNKSLDSTAKSAKEAAEESNDFLVKMEEIASNERIKLIEAKVSLDIAQLEADTKRVEAAFASINTSIQSTGDVINTSLGALTDLASSEFGGRFTEQFRILRDQIKLENNLREQSFELQRELNNAVIENLRAKSQALRRGDALIKIEGDGLAPHLEAFMFEVLEAIQVKANSELQEFLLAVQPAA